MVIGEASVIRCHCDSLVRASEAVERPDESRCSHAGLLLETDSCLPSCSGAEREIIRGQTGAEG